MFSLVSKKVLSGPLRIGNKAIDIYRPASAIPMISPSSITATTTTITTRQLFTRLAARSAGNDLHSDLQKATTDAERVEIIRRISAAYPQHAASILHSGIMEGKFVGNEYIRQYISALSKTGALDKIDMNSLLGVMNRAQGPASKQLFQGSLSGLTSASAGGMGAASSNSATNPLYVMNLGSNPTMKSKIPELLIKFLLYIVVLSIIYELITEATGASGAMGKMSKTAVHKAEKSDKRFDDVLGIDEAKHELEEIVLYLKDPSQFTRLGGKLPAGVLLTGPPGTGKTLLARAIAGEANVPFFYSSGSEFEEMFVGVGAKRVRELFKEAKAQSPCIVFIDEIDAIGGKRNEKDQSTHRMTLNQLLVEMDGFEKNSGIIVIAATNFPESLDSALVRPGRFDKRVNIPTPDISGRKKILEHYVKNVILGPDVDLEQLSRGTPGFSGAELENLVNQAAVHAAVEGLKAVTMEAFEYAKDKILMGAERKSAVLSPKTMKNTAYHEAGHAIVALFTDGADPIHKATIMPRGRALGMVMQLPEGDQTQMTLKEMLARLDVCYGGRVAEEMFFGRENVTSGATSDIEQATNLARNIVNRFGLSDAIGPILIDDRTSASMKNEVDKEVKKLLDESYQRTKALLEKHRADVDLIANNLLEHETLSGGELVDLLKGGKIDFNGQRSQRPSKPIQQIPPFERKKKTPPANVNKPATLVAPRPAPAASSSVAAEKTAANTSNSNSSSSTTASNASSTLSSTASAVSAAMASAAKPSLPTSNLMKATTAQPKTTETPTPSTSTSSSTTTSTSTTTATVAAAAPSGPAAVIEEISSNTVRVRGPPKH